MNLTSSLLVALALPSAAQETVLAVRSNGGQQDLHSIELDAGLVLESGATALQPLTPFPMQSVLTVAKVGAEVWVGNVDGVVRFGGTPLAYVDRFALGRLTTRIVPNGQGAYVQYHSAADVEEVDAAGNLIRTIPVPGVLHDLDPFQGGYLAVFGDRVYRTALDLTVLGEFGPGLAAEVLQTGRPFTPRRAAVLPDGRIAFSSSSFVVLADADGSLDAVVQAGAFESDVFATGGGAVLVVSVSGASLLDPDSLLNFSSLELLGGWTAEVNSPPFVDATTRSSGRGCTAEPNSTGSGARLHVSARTSVSGEWLYTAATRLPSQTFTIPVFGTAAYDVPFGDGRLCVSPFAPGLTRGPVRQASSTGDVEQTFDFTTPGLGAAFTAGSTWYFQVLYRDAGGSGLNGTDGVFLTFTP